MSAVRGEPRQRLREPLQRRQQNVREYQVVAATLAQSPGGYSGGMHHLDQVSALV